VRFLSTHGADLADVRGIRISGDPSILTGQPLDIALAELGGQVESLSGEYGPAIAGRSLIDGKSETVWEASTGGPQEIVLSFFKQQPALVSSVQIALPPNPAAVPKNIEVWTSMGDSADGFVKVAAADVAQQPQEQTISFTPVEARLIKLIAAPSAQDNPPAIGEIRVFEAQAPGYIPLLKRNPEILMWKPSPVVVATQASPAPTAVVKPLVLQKADIAASDFGGIIEGMTNEYGPGPTGNRLIDGHAETAWRPAAPVFPQEIVFSFFNRQPALVDAVVITAPAASSPKEVDVATSMINPTGPFQRVAAQTLSQTDSDQVVKFDPVQARYVKLRILRDQDVQPGFV
jgi:hypothetical protein